VTDWLVPSTAQKIPVKPGWYLPPQKLPLAENRFLQAGKGAENTKEKSRQCFTDLDCDKYVLPTPLSLKQKYTRTITNTTTTTTTQSHNSATQHCMFQKHDSHFHALFIQKAHAPTLITLLPPPNKSIFGKQCSVCDPAKTLFLKSKFWLFSSLQPRP
jgi:hypothetical protein